MILTVNSDYFPKEQQFPSVLYHTPVTEHTAECNMFITANIRDKLESVSQHK
jgi:hypothetical protein